MSRPWMPLYVVDYILDTKHLTTEQHGAYLLLLMVAWRRRDGALPNDALWLRSNLPPMHGRTYNALVPPILEEFFVLEENQWVSKRLRKELEKAAKFSRKQSENVSKRYAANNKNNDLEDTSVVPARALQSHSQLQSKKEKDAAGAAPVDQKDPEARVYARAREVLGTGKIGGLVTNLIKARNGNHNRCIADLEIAATKNSARQYIGGIIAKQTEDRYADLDPRAFGGRML